MPFRVAKKRNAQGNQVRLRLSGGFLFSEAEG